VVQAKAIPKQIKDAVYDALDLLQAEQPRMEQAHMTTPDPLPSLLEQCGNLARADVSSEVDSIRLIHHFACTGGTLVTKCLACVPNIHVLNEVDPLSTLAARGSKFAPADIIRLPEYSNRAPTPEEKIQLFMSSLTELYDSNRAKGLRLLIRDHSHSQFCVGDSIPQRPSLAQMLADRFPLRSIVTVRHPVDSYLSLVHNKWVHFEPTSVKEYAMRYKAFLDHYIDEPLFRYEDFVEQPDEILGRICTVLDLPFPVGYREILMIHSFSGDSGRKGSEIAPRPRRSMSENLRQEIEQSNELASLCERLDYEKIF